MKLNVSTWYVTHQISDQRCGKCVAFYDVY